MNTYFIRHTESLDIDDKTRDRLFEERRIAVHFPWTKTNPTGSERDSTSLNPNDYETSGKKALNALIELAKGGGYVCSQYFRHNDYVVGKVLPNSKIDIFRGIWGNLYDRSGKPAILKSLRLTMSRTVQPYAYAQIHIGRPRQGTIMRWRNCGDVIAKLVEGKEIVFSNDELDPLDQEIICQEFLRLNNAKFGLPRLVSLLGFPGRSMKDIDILGISEDKKRIFAQVTHSREGEIEWKKDQLRKYANPESHLILFCNCPDKTADEEMTVFPIKIALDSFLDSRAGKYYKDLKAGLNRKKV